MENLKYKSGQVAKILNISPEAIRYYEKNGIILSSKDEDNGYRSFYFHELAAMKKLRLYKSLGLNIKDSFNLIHENTINGIGKILEENEKNSLININKEKRKIKYSLKLREVISKIPDMLDKYYIDDCPSMYYIKCQNGRELLKDKLIDKEIKRWYDKSPIVMAGSIASLSDLKPWFQAEICLSIYKEDFDDFIKTKESFVEFIPARKSIHTVVKIDYDIKDFYAPVENVMKYLEDNNFETYDMIIGFPIAVNCKVSENSSFNDYYEVWIPIK